MSETLRQIFTDCQCHGDPVCEYIEQCRPGAKLCIDRHDYRIGTAMTNAVMYDDNRIDAADMKKHMPAQFKEKYNYAAEEASALKLTSFFLTEAADIEEHKMRCIAFNALKEVQNG